VLIELCMSVACFLAAPEPPAVSLDELQGSLAARLAEHVHLRIGLGDGRGAAKAFTALAAVSDDPSAVREAALALLDVYENTGLPRDIRAQLISPEADVYDKAVVQLIDAFKNLSAEHKLPDKFRGWKVLGAGEGCPVTHARAFAAGPRGAVAILSEGLALFDGRRWQMMAPSALNVYKPLQAVFIDRDGRTWLGSAASHRPGATFADRLRRYRWGSVAHFEPSKSGTVPGRWHVYGGTDRVTSFAQGKHGLWIASHSRVFIFDGEHALPVNCPLPYSPFRKLLASPDSAELWVIDLKRFSRFDGKRWRSFAKRGPFRPRGAVMVKGRPVIVLASGLLVLAGENYVLAEAPAEAGELTAAAVHRDGRVWCVTDKGRVLSTDMKNWTVYGAPGKGALPHHITPAIFCDDAGRIWVSRGRGIEVCAGDPGNGRNVAAVLKKVAVRPAPLVSAAGSGGWLEDSVNLQVPPEEKEGQPPAADDLGGFGEDGVPAPKTTKELLEAFRKSPASAKMFKDLMTKLAAPADRAMRKDALAIAVRGRNSAFYSDAARVSEFARLLLNEGRSTHAFVMLLDGWYRSVNTPFRRGIEPALFESLADMGFGEFARPEFLEVDLQWPPLQPPPGARPGIRPVTAITHTDPPLNVRRVSIEHEVGRDEFAKAGLHRAVILADKRSVLASMYELPGWKQLIDDCIEAGDAASARRYMKLVDQLFRPGPELDQLRAAITKAGPQARNADSVALSPFRWIKQLDLVMDSGLAPIVSAYGPVHVFDEGTGRRVSIDPKTGAATREKGPVDYVVRGVVAHPHGAALLVKLKDGRIGIRGHAVGPDAKPVPHTAPIAGLSDSVDSFSATPVRKGVFYCFDGGLTKVDLNAGKVAWRNDHVVGGVTFWRTLLDRSLPVPDGKDVFVVAGYKLYCVEASSGGIRWTAECRAAGTPAVVGDVVVVGTARREVWGLNRRTGKPVWKHLSAADSESLFVSDGVRVFFATQRGHVVALNAKTGEFVWRRPTDLGIRPPQSAALKPTALLVRGRRVAACNRYGYVEFDAETGAILRRLNVRTARPMAATKHGIVVATAPGRLVAVADPPADGPAGKMLDVADNAAKEGRKRTALGITRLVATYVDPVNLRAHELALRLGADGSPRHAQALYTMLVSNADLYVPEVRALMRKHLRHTTASPGVAPRIFSLVARAHLERGAVREAAEAFESFSKIRGSIEVLSQLLRLQLAGDQDEQVSETIRRLTAIGLGGAGSAFAALTAEGQEERALEIAARFAGRTSAGPLLYVALGVSGGSGLFERAQEMLRKAKIVEDGKDVPLPRDVVGRCTAYLLSNAGVADRAVRKYSEDIARDLDRFRKLLDSRRDALKALNQPRELKLLEERIELLKKAEFP